MRPPSGLLPFCVSFPSADYLLTLPISLKDPIFPSPLLLSSRSPHKSVPSFLRQVFRSMAPSQPLLISLNPPMRAHLRSLFQKRLPARTRELFASHIDELAPPSESDTGLSMPLSQHPSRSSSTGLGGQGTLDQFLDFMRGKDLNAEAPLGSEERDMGYPLSSYFVNSSHNTYLTGNQLYGESSGGAYRDVGHIPYIAA